MAGKPDTPNWDRLRRQQENEQRARTNRLKANWRKGNISPLNRRMEAPLSGGSPIQDAKDFQHGHLNDLLISSPMDSLVRLARAVDARAGGYDFPGRIDEYKRMVARLQNQIQVGQERLADKSLSEASRKFLLQNLKERVKALEVLIKDHEQDMLNFQSNHQQALAKIEAVKRGGRFFLDYEKLSHSDLHFLTMNLPMLFDRLVNTGVMATDKQRRFTEKNQTQEMLTGLQSYIIREEQPRTVHDRAEQDPGAFAPMAGKWMNVPLRSIPISYVKWLADGAELKNKDGTPKASGFSGPSISKARAYLNSQEGREKYRDYVAQGMKGTAKGIAESGPERDIMVEAERMEKQSQGVNRLREDIARVPKEEELLKRLSEAEREARQREQSYQGAGERAFQSALFQRRQQIEAKLRIEIIKRELLKRGERLWEKHKDTLVKLEEKLKRNPKSLKPEERQRGIFLRHLKQAVLNKNLSRLDAKSIPSLLLGFSTRPDLNKPVGEENQPTFTPGAYSEETRKKFWQRIKHQTKYWLSKSLREEKILTLEGSKHLGNLPVVEHRELYERYLARGMTPYQADAQAKRDLQEANFSKESVPWREGSVFDKLDLSKEEKLAQVLQDKHTEVSFMRAVRTFDRERDRLGRFANIIHELADCRPGSPEHNRAIHAWYNDPDAAEYDLESFLGNKQLAKDTMRHWWASLIAQYPQLKRASSLNSSRSDVPAWVWNGGYFPGFRDNYLEVSDLRTRESATHKAEALESENLLDENEKEVTRRDESWLSGQDKEAARRMDIFRDRIPKLMSREEINKWNEELDEQFPEGYLLTRGQASNPADRNSPHGGEERNLAAAILSLKQMAQDRWNVVNDISLSPTGDNTAYGSPEEARFYDNQEGDIRGHVAGRGSYEEFEALQKDPTSKAEPGKGFHDDEEAMRPESFPSQPAMLHEAEDQADNADYSRMIQQAQEEFGGEKNAPYNEGEHPLEFTGKGRSRVVGLSTRKLSSSSDMAQNNKE
jgi:hypothetical protein